MELIVVENKLVSQKLDPAKVFAPGGLKPIVEAIEAKVASLTLDATTAKGRKEIGSVCRLISSSKVCIDNAGKEFVGELKAKVKPADAERKWARDRLDALKEKTNRPRADWEEAEQKRIEAEEFALELEQAHTEALAENDLFDRQKEIERKEAELARQEEERRQKELAAKQEKERLEREEQLKKEAAERAKREAEERAENERLRLEAEKKEAEERAAQAERDRIAAEERARIEKENAVKEAERKAKKEAERKELERLEQQRKEKEEAEARAKKKAHRAKIKREAIRFIKGIDGTTEQQADLIFEAIAIGEVPHVKVIF